MADDDHAHLEKRLIGLAAYQAARDERGPNVVDLTSYSRNVTIRRTDGDDQATGVYRIPTAGATIALTGTWSRGWLAEVAEIETRVTMLQAIVGTAAAGPYITWSVQQDDPIFWLRQGVLAASRGMDAGQLLLVAQEAARRRTAGEIWFTPDQVAQFGTLIARTAEGIRAAFERIPDVIEKVGQLLRTLAALMPSSPPSAPPCSRAWKLTGQRNGHRCRR